MGHVHVWTVSWISDGSPYVQVFSTKQKALHSLIEFLKDNDCDELLEELRAGIRDLLEGRETHLVHGGWEPIYALMVCEQEVE